MKNSFIFKFISTVLWVIVFIITVLTVTDYLIVKNDKDPIFCLKHETKENTDGNTYICTGLLYKYYSTIGKGYVSKKFIPIWQNIEDTHE